MALHELFARRLDERAWELLTLRGVDLRELLEKAARAPAEGELPPLSFGAKEEPVLFPEGSEREVDSSLAPGQIRYLVDAEQSAALGVVAAAITALGTESGGDDSRFPST
jgi:hypothetical protein